MRKYTALILLLLLLPMTGNSQQQKTINADHNLEVAKQLEIFTSIYRNLDMMYVDTLDAKEVVGTGIKAMLHSLDPYTEYYPPTDVKELKRMITGTYGGIGSVISYNMKLKRCVINEPYLNMPAQVVGLKKGDIIISIDGEDMREKATSYVSEHLRGEAGTSFILKVERPTEVGKGEHGGKEISVKITRKAIQLPAVTYYGMLTDSIGFLSLNSFTEDCSKKVRHAVIDMKRQGMKSLILDLRNNGGGSLSEAVNILNLFLPKDLTLVKTVGRIERGNREYKTESLPIDTVMPIVVMVNDDTASASEITSGSLQDLDRGVVLGTKTYGKGLVQVPVELPFNSSLKFTNARYYIPSGRCIQKLNYKHSAGGSVEQVADSLKKEFRTLHGRVVKDGGGIIPDVVMEADSMPNIIYYLTAAGLDSTNVMMDYVVDYVAKHDSIAPARTFMITDADYADFCQRAVDAGFKYDRESEKFLESLIKVAKFEGYYDRAKDEFDALQQKLKHDLQTELTFHKQKIMQAISAEIASCYYYQAGAFENSLQWDKQTHEAIRLLRSPEEYAKILQPTDK